MITAVVEAPEAWPVVAAGLGSALIVSVITLWVARKQRNADSVRHGEQLQAASERLERQLADDRMLRDQQLDAASERLDRQLAQDREIREQQRQAEAEHLDRQLAHDRDMRDLQYLRETLSPIVANVLDWDSFVSLHKGLSTVGHQPVDEWRDVIAPLAKEVGDVTERIRRDARSLVIIAGLQAPVAAALRDVANDGDALVHLGRLRIEAGWTTPEMENKLAALLAEYGHHHARFIEAANEAVRWGEADSRAG